ncbi:protein of unknown function (plasmid) [Shinella sp. WSC3-e]|nr:hypothetical protein SHINE37_80083 [Rhizobiaceae bacterium]CAK7262009.1 protein of unknown function [Shinella sp. WSC3-e]
MVLDLRAEVAYLKRLIHGARSEVLSTIDPAQASLDLGDLSAVPVAANDDQPDGARQSARGRQPAARNIGFLPRHLPRYDVIIEPESRACACCSGTLHRIGETTSEALDVVPPILRVKRTIRPRYACRACENGVVQAPAPARFMDGGMATTALAAHIVVSKFAWHLPLYRQTQIFAGHGIALDRGTLGAWVTRVAWWLKPLYDRLLTFIRSQPRVFSDETRLPRLDPGRKRTKAASSGRRPWTIAPGKDRLRPRSAISSPRAAAPVRPSANWYPSTACFRWTDIPPTRRSPDIAARAIPDP